MLAGNGTQKTDAGIRQRTLQGTLQEGHHGSTGQGKRRTDPGAAPHGKPECSSGLPLVVLKFYPELHSGIPPGRNKADNVPDLLNLENAESGAALNRNQSVFFFKVKA
ncbi:unnamed protein product [Staurois parvus]|uniref:Uncharacterized protein n=1 Tax=Staurois parvus TaxID=386267 RepID=A0ABN9FWZ0_9NEOB|nr:unnamed protein product [Staurois parvus]